MVDSFCASIFDYKEETDCLFYTLRDQPHQLTLQTPRDHSPTSCFDYFLQLEFYRSRSLYFTSCAQPLFSTWQPFVRYYLEHRQCILLETQVACRNAQGISEALQTIFLIARKIPAMLSAPVVILTAAGYTFHLPAITGSQH